MNRKEGKSNENAMSKSSRTNFEALEKLPDEKIDYSDLPPLDEQFFNNATLRIPAREASSFIQLYSDVLTWFQSKDPHFQVLINSVLRDYITGSNQ